MCQRKAVKFVFVCILILCRPLRVPEFQPGVPWKGIQNSGDPESDPYMTPGSVLGSPGPQSLNDSDHQLLRDNIGIRRPQRHFSLQIPAEPRDFRESGSSWR